MAGYNRGRSTIYFYNNSLTKNSSASEPASVHQTGKSYREALQQNTKNTTPSNNVGLGLNSSVSVAYPWFGLGLGLAQDQSISSHEMLSNDYLEHHDYFQKFLHNLFTQVSVLTNSVAKSNLELQVLSDSIMKCLREVNYLQQGKQHNLTRKLGPSNNNSFIGQHLSQSKQCDQGKQHKHQFLTEICNNESQRGIKSPDNINRTTPNNNGVSSATDRPCRPTERPNSWYNQKPRSFIPSDVRSSKLAHISSKPYHSYTRDKYISPIKPSQSRGPSKFCAPTLLAEPISFQSTNRFSLLQEESEFPPLITDSVSTHASTKRKPRKKIHRLNTQKPIPAVDEWIPQTQKKRATLLVITDSMFKGCHRLADNNYQLITYPGSQPNHIRAKLVGSKVDNSITSVIIHNGTNSIGFQSCQQIADDVYQLIRTAQKIYPSAQIAYTGIIYRRDICSEKIEAANAEIKWVCKSLDALYVDSNSWISNQDLSRDGLHPNTHGSTRLHTMLLEIFDTLKWRPDPKLIPKQQGVTETIKTWPIRYKIPTTNHKCTTSLNCGTTQHMSEPSHKSDSVITECEGDLFNAPASMPLAHCVAADLGMQKGIALDFKRKYGHIKYLHSQNKQVGDVATLHTKGRLIFYLITKKYSYSKPMVRDLKSALQEMRFFCEYYRIKSVGMPRLGCGLDRMYWPLVRALIEDVFKFSGTRIFVFTGMNEDRGLTVGSPLPHLAGTSLTSVSSTTNSLPVCPGLIDTCPEEQATLSSPVPELLPLPDQDLKEDGEISPPGSSLSHSARVVELEVLATLPPPVLELLPLPDQDLKEGGEMSPPDSSLSHSARAVELEELATLPLPVLELRSISPLPDQDQKADGEIPPNSSLLQSTRMVELETSDTFHKAQESVGSSVPYMSQSNLDISEVANSPRLSDVSVTPLNDVCDVIVTPLSDAIDVSVASLSHVSVSPLSDVCDVIVTHLGEVSVVNVTPLSDVSVTPHSDASDVRVTPHSDASDVSVTPLSDVSVIDSLCRVTSITGKVANINSVISSVLPVNAPSHSISDNGSTTTLYREPIRTRSARPNSSVIIYQAPEQNFQISSLGTLQT